MNQESIEHLSLEEIECIDTICDAFAIAFKTENPVCIEDAIQQVPESLRHVLAMELMELEIENRRQKGAPISIEDYGQRFPQWSDTILANFAHVLLPPARSRFPSTIPGYELLGDLGRGGMGIVYKARQLNLGRVVALKIAIISSDASRNELERFRSETESAARLKHPNIVQIYDVGECNGTPFYTMEYVEGGNLADSLASRPLTSLDAARLLELLAEAVSFAHDMGVIHRDLKPSNILLQATTAKQGSSAFRITSAFSKDSQQLLVPKLTDFGLAKRIDIDQSQTQSGTIIGTPSYMAPELIESGSKVASAQADVYSLGAILYESLVGRPPFRAATMLETLEMARSKEPIPPSRFQSAVPRDLETICLKCLEKVPENRYSNASELGQDLNRFINEMPIAARPIGLFEHSWRWAKRKPILAVLLSIIGVLFVALIVVPSILAIQLRQALIQADEKKTEAIQSQRLAETRSDEADRAKSEAIYAAVQSQSRLVGMRINAGIGSTLANDPMRTLLWYEKAWHDDTYQSRSDRQHRLRVSSTLAQAPQLVGLCIHSQPIHEASLHPISKRVLIRDANANVSIWDPFLGKSIGELNHGCPVVHATFDRTGSMIATCGGNNLKIWRSEPLQLVHECAHARSVKWMCFHPKAKRMLTASDDGRLRLWEQESGKLLDASWFESEYPLEYVECSPDGNRVIAIDALGKLTAHDFDGQSLLLSSIDHPFQSQRGVHGRPQFLQNGDKLVTYSQKRFLVWDLNKGQLVGERNTQSNFRDFKFVESGERAVAATGTSLTKLFRISQLESFGDAEFSDYVAPRQTASCAITKDGQTAAVSSSGGLISIVHVEDGKRITMLRTLDLNNKLDFVSMPDGQELLFVASDDGTVRIWNLNSKSLERQDYRYECGESSKVGWIDRIDHRASLSPDASIELRVSGRKAHMVDRQRNEQIGNAFEHADEISHCFFSNKVQPDSLFVVASMTECMVRKFPSGTPVGESYRGNTAMKRVRLSNDGRRLLIWRQEQLGQVWDTENRVMLLGEPVEVDGPPSGQSFFPSVQNSDYIATCRASTLRDIDLSPDGSYVVARFEADPTTHAFRVADGGHILKTDQQYGVAAPITFANGTQRFLVCNSDTRARVWDAGTGQAAGPFLNHPTFIRFGCLNHDASLAATWSADGKLRLWNPVQGDLILESKEPLIGSAIWFRNDSKSIVVHQRNGSLFELQLPELGLPLEIASKLVQLFCSERIDSTEGIIGLPTDFFRINPEPYLNAWKSYYINGEPPQN